MTTKQMMVCDHCQKTVEFEQATGWLAVKTIVSNAETYAEYVDKHERGLQPADFGEFCSLVCVIDWAGVQKNFRELDEEVEGE